MQALNNEDGGRSIELLLLFPLLFIAPIANKERKRET
jgi:hypothetical protein